MRVVRLLVTTAVVFGGVVTHDSHARAAAGPHTRGSCQSSSVRHAEVVKRTALGIIWDTGNAIYGCSYRRHRIVRIVPKSFDSEGLRTSGLGPDVAAVIANEPFGACDEPWLSEYDLRSGHQLAFVDAGYWLSPPTGVVENSPCGLVPSRLHIARDRSVVWAEHEQVTDAEGNIRSWGEIRLLRSPGHRLTELDSGFDLSDDVQLNRLHTVVAWTKAGRKFSSTL